MIARARVWIDLKLKQHGFRNGIVVACCFCLALSGCTAKTQLPPLDQSPAAQMFRRNCASCHGAHGDGQQVGAKVVPSLKTGKAATDSDAHLVQQISGGGNGMPPFKFTLSEAEVRLLVLYIRNLQHGGK